MRILREWLQITCRGPYTGFEKMENFGQISRDYFESIQSGRMASFVVRLQKGQTQKLRICAPGRSSSLFVNWPDSAERPLHIALGKGSECERDQEEEEDE